MGDTGSEATSPYPTSERANSSMYTHSYHTYQQYFGQEMDEVTAHSQPSQCQVLQGEPSEFSNLSRKRCFRGKMSEAERKEHKRQIDKRHRQKKKKEENSRIAENENLKRDIGWLSAENSRLTAESVRLSDENRCLKNTSELLTTENRQLTLQVKHLQFLSSRLSGKGQLVEQIPQKQDSYISHSTSHVDHPNVYEQDHLGMGCNYETAFTFDGLEMNDLVMSEAFSEDELIPSGRGSLDESAPEVIESSRSGVHYCQMALTELLAKLEAEVPSSVDLSYFSGLEAERRKFGRYSFPLSLIPIVERINATYGDVSAKCLMNLRVSEEIYVIFCAAIKEMDDLQLQDITEDKMLKWRDAINDAKRIDFDVRFAMKHLKRIASAYFGLLASQQLQNTNANISKLERKLNHEKRKHAMICEDLESLIAAAQQFNEVPVSRGLFTQEPDLT